MSLTRLQSLAILLPASLVLGLATGCAGILGSGDRESQAAAQIKPGYFFGHDFRQQANIVYVLDLSGSMAEASGTVVEQVGTNVAADAAGSFVGGLVGRRTGNQVRDRVRELNKKVEKVKLHLIASLHGLPAGAKFNVILFSDGVQRLAPGMIPANGFTVGAVSAFVAQLEEGGGTNLYAAVDAALASNATHVVVLTDGMPTSSSPEAILDLIARKNYSGRFRVSTVGVGGDQAREFLSAMAHHNGGAYTSYN